MSLEELEEDPEAKAPFSEGAREAPRRARSRATPAPAMPPPMTTASNVPSSIPDSLVTPRAPGSIVARGPERSRRFGDRRDASLRRAPEWSPDRGGGP